MPVSPFLKFSPPQRGETSPFAEPVAPTELSAATSTASIRETIDLLELDLGAMIQDVAIAAASVRSGASASADALAAIQARTATLSAQSQDARRDALQVADATVELAQSSNEIDRQVRAAGALTDDAGDAALAANRSVDELKASTAEIGQVVNLIANIARQTNLLALMRQSKRRAPAPPGAASPSSPPR